MSGQITFEIRHQFTSSQCFFEKIILITPGILSPSDLDGIDRSQNHARIWSFGFLGTWVIGLPKHQTNEIPSS